VRAYVRTNASLQRKLLLLVLLYFTHSSSSSSISSAAAVKVGESCQTKEGSCCTNTNSL
jgi:hypothetical protein